MNELADVIEDADPSLVPLPKNLVLDPYSRVDTNTSIRARDVDEAGVAGKKRLPRLAIVPVLSDRFIDGLASERFREFVREVGSAVQTKR